jgi:predicted nucleic acid-binding protein
LSAATPGPTEPPPYGGRTLVVDTSAWAILRKALSESPRPPLVREFFDARAEGQLRGHTAAKLEVLHSAQNPADFLEIEERLDRLETLRITATASDAAVGALRDLSAGATSGQPTLHRVKAGDVLIAATAAEHGFDVLHFDHHFDLLATVLGFESVWIAPPGRY